MTGTTRPATPARAARRLREGLARQIGLGSASAATLLGTAMKYDKTYELSCLVRTLRELRTFDPALRFRLMQDNTSVTTNVTFRQSGGPIDRASWPRIDVVRSGTVQAEIWTDIVFQTLSARLQGKPMTYPVRGRGHELDLVVVTPGTTGYPKPRQIWIGVEAKHREFTKGLLKELLGVRREMCFVQRSRRSNPFAWWSGGRIRANPPSGLVAFCKDANISAFDDPAEFWGIAMLEHRA